MTSNSKNTSKYEGADRKITATRLFLLARIAAFPTLLFGAIKSRDIIVDFLESLSRLRFMFTVIKFYSTLLERLLAVILIALGMFALLKFG